LDALTVIWAPVRSLSRIAEERRVLLGFGVVALYATLQLIAGVVDVLGGVTASTFDPEAFPGVPPDLVEDVSQSTGVTTLLSAVLSPFVGWTVVSLLMQLVTRFFGGTGPLPGMFAVVGVAAAPLVILAAIKIPVTGIQAAVGPESAATSILSLLLILLSIAAYAWNIALVVIGAAFARRVGYGQSAGSCAISCAGCASLIILVALVIGALVFAALGAAGSSATP
jgi:hypothetical protein